MINAKELRIGNLVYFNGNHNHIGPISGLGNKSILKYYCIEYEKELKVFLNNRYDISYSPLNLKPIPLTEEWLLKLGFKFIIRNMWELKIDFCTKLQFYDNQDDYITLHIKNYKDMEFDGETYTYLKHIKHVHQLQNLYFALTNEELTLKL